MLNSLIDDQDALRFVYRGIEICLFKVRDCPDHQWDSMLPSCHRHHVNGSCPDVFRSLILAPIGQSLSITLQQVAAGSASGDLRRHLTESMIGASFSRRLKRSACLCLEAWTRTFQCEYLNSRITRMLMRLVSRLRCGCSCGYGVSFTSKPGDCVPFTRFASYYLFSRDSLNIHRALRESTPRIKPAGDSVCIIIN
jgi:hypothetical protein